MPNLYFVNEMATISNRWEKIRIGTHAKNKVITDGYIFFSISIDLAGNLPYFEKS